MPIIFISYRREDNPDAAGRIYDRLAAHFGESDVFFDIDTIPFGVNYVEYIDEFVAKCDVVIVVIGDSWLCSDEAGELRLESCEDFVRIEIESALKRDIPVIPVTVGNARVPRASDLPDSIRELTFRNAAEVRSGTSFQGHMQRLISGIESQVVLSQPTAPAPNRQTRNDADSTRTEPDSGKSAEVASDATTLQPGAPNVKRTFLLLAGVSLIASVLFALFSVAAGVLMELPRGDVSVIYYASFPYFGLVTVTCFCGWFYHRPIPAAGALRKMFCLGIVLGLIMSVWTSLLDGQRITFDEVFIAWVIAAIAYVVVLTHGIKRTRAG